MSLYQHLSLITVKSFVQNIVFNEEQQQICMNLEPHHGDDLVLVHVISPVNVLKEEFDVKKENLNLIKRVNKENAQADHL